MADVIIEEDAVKAVAYPNPTSGMLHLKYEIGQDDLVGYVIYSSTGQLVASQTPELKTVGEYEMDINLTDMQFSPGLYHVRLLRGSQTDDFRILLNK
jgi:hypothetical protein